MPLHMSLKSWTLPSLALAGSAVLYLAGRCNPHKSQACMDREMRDSLSEKQIDKMLKDTFPASDPPSTY